MGQPHVPENLSDQKSRGLDDAKTMIIFLSFKAVHSRGCKFNFKLLSI